MPPFIMRIGYQMKAMKSPCFALLFLLILTGCVGRDFTRPMASEMILGKTTKSEILALLGEPRSTTELITNGEKIEKIGYAYARGASAGQISQAKAMSFSLHSNLLVGSSYVSSFSKDSTFFESARVTELKKGVTTKSEAIQIFGKPSGEMMFPLTKSPEETVISYAYAQVRGTGFGSAKDTKVLVITFDGNGIVTNYVFSNTGI
jgi:outer membrane protein assembly factor BamE (lipoprotein component of BamABCDE complex)